MKSLDSYLAVLKEIRRRTGADISFKEQGRGISINGQRFISKQDDESQERDVGYIVDSLSKAASDKLIASQKSFLTARGDLYLANKDMRLQINLQEKAKKRVLNSKKKSLSPTLIVSPNGLAITDVLFRSSIDELEVFKSGLSFAKHHDLVQSKLSQMMTALNAKSLTELKLNIQKLSMGWWSSALRYPMTRKRMTPFFEVAETYYSNSEQWIHIFEKFGAESEKLIPGPMNLAADLGFLRSKDFSYWVTKENIQQLKRKYQLVPGTKPGLATCYLASPAHQFSDEAIVSRKYEAHESHANQFRSIWDMGFGDERMSEIQIDCLAKLISRARE